MSKIAGPAGIDKNKLVFEVMRLMDTVWDEDPEDEYAAELLVIPVVMAIGRLLMMAVLARRCFKVAQAEIADRGLATWRFRLDESYCTRLATTFGVIAVVRFAYRFESHGVWVTRMPSASVMPMHPRCRSSTALLRVELALGCRMPFREAQGVMGLLNDAATVHDTTISDHLRVVSSVVDRSWSYLPTDDIDAIVADRAVLDGPTGRPLVFFSCDAHAELFYDDKSWSVLPKMVNGIRVWTIDRNTGKAISLGGEFVFGDCYAVAAAFDDLDARGILPFNGTWDGVEAEIVFVADGMPWFDDHILAKFARCGRVLDAYHVLERLGTYLKSISAPPAGATVELKRLLSKSFKAEFAKFKHWIIGKTNKRAPRRLRRMPRDKDGKPKKPTRQKTEAYALERTFPKLDFARLEALELPLNTAGAVIAHVLALPAPTEDKLKAARAGLISYLETRIEAIDYATAWRRGWPLSSAPMESFNRVAQVRLKRPGATWTVEAADAMMKVRLMHVMGREKEFWSSPEQRKLVVEAFWSKKRAA